MERCREKKLRKNFERNNTLKVENKGFFSMLDQEKREKEKRREREREREREKEKEKNSSVRKADTLDDTIVDARLLSIVGLDRRMCAGGLFGQLLVLGFSLGVLEL